MDDLSNAFKVLELKPGVSLEEARQANATFRYNPGVWYHVAYVVTPTNYTIYINGDMWGTGRLDSVGNPLLYDESHPLRLGVDGVDGGALDGSLAQVRVWSVARSAEQIKSVMNASLAGNEPGLQGDWRFEEGSGTTTADRSGHGFTATLVGGVSWTTNGPLTLH